ncbi:probable xanthine/uracil permeases [Ramularia collo-cygni]|uniref:Probable xanthine/uracil permeases n=1 Tax=Ramularia collo-cygni TaxID=112498 RepID=A0A2D3VD01_9PEZI|nr:probable xanthine/uracil permeases [Ramularia collo-cygni]CZT19529.1 probable xanthine/uracil permeases [Ramularia collo-cygni]
MDPSGGEYVKDDHPSEITPTNDSPKRTWSSRGRALVKAFTTREGLIGTYDYAFLFTPKIPFTRTKRRSAPFFGLNDRMPVVLALLLGLQHSLAMLAGIITPPIVLSGAANFTPDMQSYLVSTSLIVCAALSCIQITRFHIWKTPYFVGTGLISVVGVSFSTIPIATGALSQMYANGFCPTDANGTKLPCPDGYGAILGTQCICALIEVALSFMPPAYLKKIFPPLVTGPTVLLIGVKLISSGFKNWAGGSGDCMARPETGLYRLCPDINAPHPLPWGSAEFIGLGFLVFLTIILCERFGAPIMKSCAVVIGLLVGCIVAAACGYFDRSGIDAAPVASFVWVYTFKLSVYGPIVLPLLAVYIVLTMETIGDVTATCDLSRLQVDGPMFDSRIQGGVLADGLNGILAGLCTITPMSTFAQNNGVIALTRCANRKAGYACCFWLVLVGIFAKFAASLVAIPSAVLGGMTTFLFAAVASSGIRIISTMPFTRRNRFILTACLTLGFGATLVPTWFDYVFTYSGDNQALSGFYSAITLVMQTGFAVAGFVALVLNLVLPEEDDDEDVPELSTNDADDAADREEWNVIEGDGGSKSSPSEAGRRLETEKN